MTIICNDCSARSFQSVAGTLADALIVVNIIQPRFLYLIKFIYREMVKRKREKKNTRPPIIKVDTYNDTNGKEKKKFEKNEKYW